MTDLEAGVMIAFQRKWATSPMPALAPGGLHHGRVPQDRVAPYASIQVKALDPEWNSSSTYLQVVQVTIRVWGAAGSGPVTAGDMAGVMGNTYDGQEASLLLPRGRAMWIQPKAGALEQDPATSNAADVILAVGNWDVTIQLTRRP